jgi:FAD/FMN-containing dehydrogenase
MFKLWPQPDSYVTAFAAIPQLSSALPILNGLQDATGGQVIAFEVIQGRALDLVVKHIPGATTPLSAVHPWLLLIEVANFAALDFTDAVERVLAGSVDQGSISDVVIAKSARERTSLWRIREAIPEAQRKQGASIANDISVPLAVLAEFVENAEAAVRDLLPSAMCITFGHVGDGNLHFAVLAAGDDQRLDEKRHEIEAAVQECVWRLNGSISAEHGIGVARREAFNRQKSEAEIQTMRALKRVFDPNNILNPGKLLGLSLP